VGSLGAPGSGIVVCPPTTAGPFAGDDCCGMTGPPNKDSFGPKVGKPFDTGALMRPIFFSLATTALQRRVVFSRKRVIVCRPAIVLRVEAQLLGKHRVQLVAQGYRDWVGDVEVKAGTTVNVTGRFQK
jgi:hypothetical protein